MRYAVNSELAEGDLADIWVEIATVDIDTAITLSKSSTPLRRNSLNNLSSGSTTEFLMSAGNARLLIRVAEQSNIVLKFQRVRWHEFTAVYNCSTDQIQSAYFKLMRLDDSERLAKYVMADGAAPKAYTQLHHFRIFLHEHGCHELFAQSFSVVE